MAVGTLSGTRQNVRCGLYARFGTQAARRTDYGDPQMRPPPGRGLPRRIPGRGPRLLFRQAQLEQRLSRRSGAGNAPPGHV